MSPPQGENARAIPTRSPPRRPATLRRCRPPDDVGGAPFELAAWGAHASYAGPRRLMSTMLATPARDFGISGSRLRPLHVHSGGAYLQGSAKTTLASQHKTNITPRS